MSRLATLVRRLGPRLALALPLLVVAADALARGGGGHSYSGGSRSIGGGGGGGGGDGLVWLLFHLVFRYPKVGVPVLVIVIAVVWMRSRTDDMDSAFSTGGGDLRQAASVQAQGRAGQGRFQLEALRQADPDFSEPLFLDFVAALVARVVAVVGTPRMAEVERYLVGPVVVLPFVEGGWENVVVGSLQLSRVTVSPKATTIVVTVALGASNAAGGRWWRTAWTFTRQAGVHSKGPGEITRLACPACGAGAERNEDGSCRYCAQKPAPGEAAWAVAEVRIMEVERRPPVALGGYAEEVGTGLSTIRSPGLRADLERLGESLPGFDWTQTQQHYDKVFLELQRAWSDRDLAAIRPLCTDAVFSTWRYWIEAYRAAGLRNQLGQVQVKRLEPVKVSLDKYFAAITVRIFASMVDRTVDDGGRVVDGKATPRPFSEYWTFVRTLSAARPEGATCPGCGATLKAGQSGQCPYCGALVGAGAFDWILSRIDQDEDYEGT